MIITVLDSTVPPQASVKILHPDAVKGWNKKLLVPMWCPSNIFREVVKNLVDAGHIVI